MNPLPFMQKTPLELQLEQENASLKAELHYLKDLTPRYSTLSAPETMAVTNVDALSYASLQLALRGALTSYTGGYHINVTSHDGYKIGYCLDSRSIDTTPKWQLAGLIQAVVGRLTHKLAQDLLSERK